MNPLAPKKLDKLMLENPSFYIRVNHKPDPNFSWHFYANLIDSRDDMIVEVNGYAMVWAGFSPEHAIQQLYHVAELYA